MESVQMLLKRKVYQRVFPKHKLLNFFRVAEFYLFVFFINNNIIACQISVYGKVWRGFSQWHMYELACMYT